MRCRHSPGTSKQRSFVSFQNTQQVRSAFGFFRNLLSVSSIALMKERGLKKAPSFCWELMISWHMQVFVQQFELRPSFLSYRLKTLAGVSLSLSLSLDSAEEPGALEPGKQAGLPSAAQWGLNRSRWDGDGDTLPTSTCCRSSHAKLMRKVVTLRHRSHVFTVAHSSP